ncbi:MAG: hypothetical protein ACREVR_18175 [Burkholderiales bacterium]
MRRILEHLGSWAPEATRAWLAAIAQGLARAYSPNPGHAGKKQ